MSTSDNRTNSRGVNVELTQVPRSVEQTTAFNAAGYATRDWRLLRALDMIQSRPTQSVRELALQVRLSPAHLQRLCKHELGVNVSSLIVERRLLTAAQLLAKGELSIKEIAHAVGYNHHSSFVRAFQRRFAEAPRQYRRRSLGVGPQLRTLSDNIANS
jgi:AraC-like DNA-binding protein